MSKKEYIEVNELPAQGLADFVFDVGLGKYKYQVTFSAEYFRKLTGGRISAADLVKKSFEFLLKREGPEAIRKRFELPKISQYFPDYETEIRGAVAA